MPRYFAPITIEEFEIKMKAAMAAIGDEYDFPYMFKKLTPKVVQDWKVEVDFENCEVTPNEKYPNYLNNLLGYHTLPNGLTFMGGWAGGDWETPVFFLFYWDGQQIRCYIPTDGNPWNTDTKQAYGNDGEADLENAKKRWPETFKDADEIDQADFAEDEVAILADILKRIEPNGLVVANVNLAAQENKKGKIVNPKILDIMQKTVPERLGDMPFFGINDEAYEYFCSHVQLAKQLWYGDEKEKAKTVCDWAKDLSNLSVQDAIGEYGSLDEAKQNMDYEYDHWQ